MRLIHIFKQYFGPKITDNVEFTRKSLLLDVITSIELLIIFLWYISTFLQGISLNATLIFVSVTAHAIVLKRINHLGYVHFANILMVYGLLLIFTISLFLMGGIFTDYYTGMIPVIIISSLLLDKKHVLLTSILSLISGFFAYLLDPFLPPLVEQFTLYTKFISTTSFIVITGSFMYYSLIIRDRAILFSTEAKFESMMEKFNINQEQEQVEHFSSIVLGISHDFNNFLTAIRNYDELLHIDSSENESKEVLSQITDKLVALNKLLMEYVKGNRNELIEININDLLLQNEQIYLKLLGKSITMELELDESLKLVKINPTHFDQIISNLLVNAREAIVSKGLIRIETSMILQNNAESVCLKIIDNGTGIPPKILPNLFKPFFSTKPTGTGIGLLTVKQIVEESSGSISVDSEFSKGTTFTILFPVSKE
ncbi:MAG: hypothetical protein INQ03_02035 [Candidatus Heimdallarchaeota archaeon]|nr:hypothetical protein [Candidatus Heimdallarchaeota archaeon]